MLENHKFDHELSENVDFEGFWEPRISLIMGRASGIPRGAIAIHLSAPTAFVGKPKLVLHAHEPNPGQLVYGQIGNRDGAEVLEVWEVSPRGVCSPTKQVIYLVREWGIRASALREALLWNGGPVGVAETFYPHPRPPSLAGICQTFKTTSNRLQIDFKQTSNRLQMKVKSSKDFKQTSNRLQKSFNSLQTD